MAESSEVPAAAVPPIGQHVEIDQYDNDNDSAFEDDEYDMAIGYQCNAPADQKLAFR